jgi:SAM-dependent methyltransferase
VVCRINIPVCLHFSQQLFLGARFAFTAVIARVISIGCNPQFGEHTMPTSPFAHLYTLVSFLDALRPKSILDVGLGNGKLGFIARDLLDVMCGEQYHRSRWRLKLDGIEVFEDYIQEHQRAIYDEIYIGDAFDVIDRIGNYDMIILGDVLEHFDKEKGTAFMEKCIRHTNEAVSLFIPLGDGWSQPAIYGNPYETHRSSWHLDELKPLSSKHQIYQYQQGRYGAFLIPKQHYIDRRIKALNDLAFDQQHTNRSGSIREKYGLSREAISRIDLKPLSKHAACPRYSGFFLNTGFTEHYQLLACLSTRFEGATLFDIGTLKGYSALALSYNPANRVKSYDIQDVKELAEPQNLTTIEYRIGNVLHDPELLSSPLILLDTEHDGTFETQVYAFLKQNHYKGLLVLDDIYLNDAMKRFWQAIDLPKEDLTDIGHWSGTGIVDFGQSE